MQITHIEAAQLGGPRYNLAMSADQRKSFGNLILLCHPHHLVVDKIRPDDFSVETLKAWKADRESNYQAALSQLREVTPERLQQILSDALEEYEQRLTEVIGRLEASDAEAATVLRALVSQMAEQRRLNLPDPQILAGFTLAADRLFQVFESCWLDQLIRVANRFPDR